MTTLLKRISALTLGLSVLASAGFAPAGPLHDPFLEKFQVGTWPRAEDVTLAQGYPAGLLEPAVLDTTWTRAALRLLDGDGSERDGSVTGELLPSLFAADQEAGWLAAARQATMDLIAGRAGAPDILFLKPERLTMAFGKAVGAGNPERGAAIAAQILEEASELGIPARERLVWELRRGLCLRLAQPETAFDERLWPAFPDLGPFDTVNAWALWTACRTDRGLSLLPTGGDHDDLVGVLARLRAGAVAAEDLYGSELEGDAIAGLGGILLSRNGLSAHFERFSSPPSGFAAQGRWVRGQRRLRNGAAAAYENLAQMPGLHPAWRMDVWRRASERRLLKGAWVEGLDDLRQALDLAEAGHGTKSLRKRLREWTEQVLVLAVVQGDTATARNLLAWGRGTFAADELAAFEAETLHWHHVLDSGGTPAAIRPKDSVDRARLVIAAGQAADLANMTADSQADFIERSELELWTLWHRWGLALADPSAVTGDKAQRAAAYRDRLAAFSGLESPDDIRRAYLSMAGHRLGDRSWREVLLRTAVDVDTSRLSAWQTPPRPSPVPDLLPEVRGSELDRHALLGFSLACKDMRGILGLAFEIPARGLTRAEKRLFLYPLPGEGAIRAAIADAESEPALLLAIARNESLFEPAVRSRAGALGWMQIMPFHYPENGARFGPDNWRTPAVSVRQGDALVVENMNRYQRDPYRVLAAYNAGPGAADRWDAQLGGQAPRDIYLAWIGYPETRAYVEKVLIDREIYTEIIGAKNVEPLSVPAAGPTNE